MTACQLGNSYDFCNSFTEATEIQEPTNITADVSITDEQDDRFYEGLDCDNAVGNTYISCELISIMLGVTKK
jgi:hypothetical protein